MNIDPKHPALTTFADELRKACRPQLQSAEALAPRLRDTDSVEWHFSDSVDIARVVDSPVTPAVPGIASCGELAVIAGLQTAFAANPAGDKQAIADAWFNSPAVTWTEQVAIPGKSCTVQYTLHNTHLATAGPERDRLFHLAAGDSEPAYGSLAAR